MLKGLYEAAQISKQGHHQNLQRQLAWQEKQPCYLGLMETIRLLHPGMGLREIYQITKPEGIGRDAFITLGMDNGYRLVFTKNKFKTTFSHPSALWSNLLEDKEFTGVNQVWSSDITYFQIADDCFYIVLIMDVYSRRIIGYNVENHMRASSNLKALQMALNLRGITDYQDHLIHHSDRGGQYVSELYTDQLNDYNIQISMCQCVYENAHIERANGTIKNQYLRMYKKQAKNLRQLKKALVNAINAYNETKPHSSLNKLSPIQFENELKNISVEDREKIKIFTVKNNRNLGKQLVLF